MNELPTHTHTNVHFKGESIKGYFRVNQYYYYIYTTLSEWSITNELRDIIVFDHDESVRKIKEIVAQRRTNKTVFTQSNWLCNL